MGEFYRILRAYGSRLVQLHVSEVNSASQHDPITYATKRGFQSIAHFIPPDIPLIIESKVSPERDFTEITNVLESVPATVEAVGLLA
jgi:hypothetical protein